MTATDHAHTSGYALRAPWYVREREHINAFDPAAARPAIQKHATADFVDRLIADPRDSLAFDPDDVWSFPVPLGAFPDKGTVRERLSTHRLVRTDLRKLYQPSHARFYTVVVEVFCDEPGLPRPGGQGPPEVGFVIRRQRIDVHPQDAAALRRLARITSRDLYDRAFPDEEAHDPDDDQAEDVTGLLHLQDPADPRWTAFEAKHAALLAEYTISHVLEGWVVADDGTGRWTAISANTPLDASHGPEQELPMWHLPPSEDDCDAAKTRSLWFGVVPTFSQDFDIHGQPRFDDRSVYVLQCFVRRRSVAGCPPTLWWSGQSLPYRLAAFFDPDGTKNHQVRVKLPDLRVLAARASEPPSAGVQLERPAGSQIPPPPLGQIPSTLADPGGGSSEICSYAIELITIVASFVLALFLPVVVFALRLWWMLLLKFCWPPNKQALDVISASFIAHHTIQDFDQAGLDALDQLLGAPGAAAKLAGAPGLGDEEQMGKDFVDAIQPQRLSEPAPPTPEPKPDDPLCA